MHFDLAVIGSGSGLSVSSAAAEAGQSVAVIENGPFGGTCLNRGCIPSKMLIHSADVMETIRGAHQFGITAKVESVDWPAIINRVNEEIDGDAANIERGNREIENITVYSGSAKFTGEKTIEVNGEEITADTVLVAAGTRPAVPDLPGLEPGAYITSDEALRLSEQPERLTILGSGYIAGEMAHFFGSLGTDVTIIARSGSLLRHEDRDVSTKFTEVYSKRFNVMLNADAERVEKNSGGVQVSLDTPDGKKTVEGDQLLVAIGRVPNTDTLEVSKAGIATNDRGFVQVDEYLRTSADGVWALGDIVGKYQLKHNANLEASYCWYNMNHADHMTAVDYTGMPHAVFAWPQVASVGLTEREAEEHGVNYTVGKAEYINTAYGKAIEDKDGFVKVLADPEDGKLLGCHIIGQHASMLIQEAVNVMRAGNSVDAITQSIHIHPALTEVVDRAFGDIDF